jgi:hypothetical protein
MIRTAVFSAAALIIGSLLIPFRSETVSATCTLARFDTTTVWDLSLSSKSVERFGCSFSQNGGNVQVNSNKWSFTFLAQDQGTGYIRINTLDDITFTKTGQYSLRVAQKLGLTHSGDGS